MCNDGLRRMRVRWREELAAADTWLLRGVLLGGERALAQAVPVDRACIDVEWAALMGVRHPAAVAWTAPVRSPAEQMPPHTSQLPCWISTCLASAFSAPRPTLTVSMPSV